ncbi:hypothetical protein VCV18_007272 [Metarhizium anisopliae]
MLLKKGACLITTQASSSVTPFEPRQGITKAGKSIKFKVNIDMGRQGKTGCNCVVFAETVTFIDRGNMPNIADAGITESHAGWRRLSTILALLST